MSRKNAADAAPDGRPRRDRPPRALFFAPALALALAGCADAVVPEQEVTCGSNEVVASISGTIPVAPNGYAVVGNELYSVQSCQPARLVGVSRPSLSFSSNGQRLGEDTSRVADFARIREWKATAVRIELAQYYWLSGSRFHDPGYRDRVDRTIRAARDAGLDVIIALQHSDRGDPNFPQDPRAGPVNMHQPMPDRNHSIPFWREVAARYKDDGRILFELYGEPYPVGGEGGFSNWDLWRSGGPHPSERVYGLRSAFEAAGMQELYAVVRETGARNVVIVSGTQWGYYLNGVPGREIEGYNIAYATHPWDYVNPETGRESRQPATWDRDWAFLAARHPVMITEFGSYDCSTDYAEAVLDKADELGLSWIAWAWQAPGRTASREENSTDDPICEFPMLLTDWDGTPSKSGKVVKDRLASY